MIDRTVLPYRLSTKAIVINEQGLFLVVQKNIYGDHQWEFPGGGIEKDETPEKALKRELKEELGTNKFVILKKSPIKDQYEWPEEYIENVFAKSGTKYRGQILEQFLVKFTGDKKDLLPNPNEIKKVEWISKADFEEYLVFEEQLETTLKTIKSFENKIQ